MTAGQECWHLNIRPQSRKSSPKLRNSAQSKYRLSTSTRAGSSRPSTARGSPPSSCARCPGSTWALFRPHPRTRASAPARWAWLLDGRVHGRPATVHAEGCGNATDRAHPLGTMQALDALARPGTTACTACDAAEALLPILAHGQDDVPAASD
ncbi:DUF6233 domain-containing protein [Streptomyces sp. NPDC048723]|uniref:DUF6233 domain-containing protein n=1 Tax=Streptomyces sp. NPDC048723 TaxID=3365589 RepID=UPI0037121BCB